MDTLSGTSRGNQMVSVAVGGATFPTKFRLRHARSANGCLPCRSRKKKCDECRPLCTACRTKQLECRWPEPKQQPRHKSPNKIASPTPPDHQRALTRTSNVHSSPYQGPGRSFPNSSAACQLNNHSMALLQHYFSETATVLPADFQYGNPFIRHVIPAAHANDALMHAVLSMSGAQLTYRLGDALPIKLATYQHYSRTLLEIRKHLAAIERKDEVVTPELCLALIFLCNYEILARSSSATFRLHLRALRHCINSLSKDNANSLRRSQNDDVQVFLRADYNYILFCNVITPSAVDQHLGLDWYSVHSENDSEDTNMESIFAGSHDLFALIPRAASLYHARLDEEAAGLVEPSTELQTKHNELLSCIESWEMDNGRMMTPAATVAEKDNNGCYGQNRTLFKEKRATAAECIRDCLRIYTLLSLAGSSAGPQFAQDELLATHVSSVYWMLASLQGSSCMAHMIWAIVIVGSCVVDKAQQALLANGLTQSTYRMPHLENIRLVLELLWEDEDPRAFGPYGLLLIERKHGLKLSVL